MTTVNSPEYWNNRFHTDWENAHGPEQTTFFGHLLADHLPAWMRAYLDHKRTWLDWGCAMGDALPVIHKAFPKLHLTGYDIAAEGIEHARATHPSFSFYSNLEELETFDLVVTSNTLEHFQDPYKHFPTLAKLTRGYVVILVPYQEKERIKEHEFTFDPSTIPAEHSGMHLVYMRPIDARQIQNTFWWGDQILLVYARNDATGLPHEGQPLMETTFANYQQIEDMMQETDKRAHGYEQQLQTLYNQVAELETKLAAESEEHHAAKVYNGQLQARIREIEKSLTWRLMRAFTVARQPKVLYHKVLYQGGKMMPEGAKQKIRPLFGIDVNYHRDTFVAHFPRVPRKPALLLLAVVPMDDSGGGQRSAQLAREYLARGYDVTYVSAFPKQEHAKVDADYTHEQLTEVEAQHFDLDTYFSALNGDLTVIVEAPHEKFLPAVRRANEAKAFVIYDAIDKWDSALGGSWYKPGTEKEIIPLCTCIASADDLLDHVTAIAKKPATLVPNAFNSHTFDPAKSWDIPEAMRSKGPHLLYVGALWGYWFDWELLHAIAVAMPEATLHVVGDYAGQYTHKDANVMFHGLQAHADVPRFVAGADVCLIPFKVDDMIEAVNPLKVYEYLAMRKPVVASAMKELRDMPNVLRAENHGAFIAAIKTALTTPFDTKAHDSFIHKHSWQARVDTITALDTRPNASVIVLNYNNMQVIEKCIAGLLEQAEAEDTEVLMVDNQSSDGSYEYMLEKYGENPRLTILRNEKNGCSSGRNLGLKHAKGKNIIFVDSDQWPTEDHWTSSGLRHLQEDGSVGAVGWGGGWLARNGKGGTIFSYLPNMGLVGKEKTRRDIAYLATCGFFMPSFLLGKGVWFDEFYDPTCYEDTDLAFQVKKAGYALLYDPMIPLHHEAHTTTSTLKEYSTLFHRNAEYMMKKWKKYRHFIFDTSHRSS